MIKVGVGLFNGLEKLIIFHIFMMVGLMTKLSSIMVCRPREIELESVHTNQGDIQVYTLVPIYEEERNLALEKGHKYLINKMLEKGVTDVLYTKRMNVGND